MEAVRCLTGFCMGSLCERAFGENGMPLGCSGRSCLDNSFCQFLSMGTIVLDLLYYGTCIRGVPDAASYKCSD